MKRVQVPKEGFVASIGQLHVIYLTGRLHCVPDASGGLDVLQGTLIQSGKSIWNSSVVS